MEGYGNAHWILIRDEIIKMIWNPRHDGVFNWNTDYSKFRGSPVTSVLHFTLSLQVTKLSLWRRGRDRIS